MQFTVELPDDLASQLIPAGSDPARTALEDMAVAAYRARRLTEHQLATLLGMGRYELDGFLKEREVWFDLSADDLEQELAAGQKLWQKRRDEQESSARQ
jgi:predicted HTH domain antitoxin